MDFEIQNELKVKGKNRIIFESALHLNINESN